MRSWSADGQLDVLGPGRNVHACPPTTNYNENDCIFLRVIFVTLCQDMTMLTIKKDLLFQGITRESAI